MAMVDLAIDQDVFGKSSMMSTVQAMGVFADPKLPAGLRSQDGTGDFGGGVCRFNDDDVAGGTLW